MSRVLIEAIRKHTEVLCKNAEIMLQTCDLDFILCDMPIWKHVYHALHSLDQWFINPTQYREPSFHVANLNSLDIPSETALSRATLLQYLAGVRGKLLDYIDSLTDEMLTELPPGCGGNRLSLMLSQFRHFYAHLRNVNAATILETNQWPRVIGITGKSGASTDGLFE